MSHPQPAGRAPLVAGSGAILVLLYLGYLLSFADRVIFGMVLKPIKETMGFSDAQLGLLSGVAFAFSYAVFSPLAGFFVDRKPRKLLMAGAISFWSVMTLATGLATSFVTMGLARLGVGAGEAFLHPLAVSLVSDTVPPARRSRAFSFYLSAGAVGSTIALLFGGLLIRRLMKFEELALPVLGPLAPWQGLFVTAAVPGFLLSIVVLLIMREPARLTGGEHGPQTAGDDQHTAMSFLRQHPRLCWAIFPGISLLQMASYTMTTWKVVFFERVYGWSGGDAAVWIGCVGGGASILGCLAAGRLIGWLRARGYADAPLRLCVVSGVCYAVFGIAGLLAGNPYVSIALFGGAFFWSYVPSVAAFSAMGDILPPATRARLAGLHTLTNGLISNSLGPFLVGFFSDNLFTAEAGIRSAMALTVFIAAVCGLASVVAGLGPYRRRANAPLSGETPAPGVAEAAA
jgi:MFS family permease